ncbi:MAG: glycosyltransferase, partial [Deltaproteobacteria bacterium]|nr:glycosyltransferase [Deltaproteobacteria bacterium]
KETENILKERYKIVVGIDTKYQVNDEKVIKYFYKENGGVSSAINYGLKKASGEYINFLADDDLLLPEKIELQVSFFKKNEKNWGNLGVVYSGYLIMEKGVIIDRIKPKYRGNVFRQLLYDNLSSAHSLLVKAECFNKVGFFDETLFFREDWDMLIILSKHYEFDYVDDYLALYRVFGGNKSLNISKAEKYEIIVLDRYWDQIKEPDLLKDKNIVYSAHFRSLAYQALVNEDHENFKRLLVKALKYNPRIAILIPEKGIEKKEDLLLEVYESYEKAKSPTYKVDKKFSASFFIKLGWVYFHNKKFKDFRRLIRKGLLINIREISSIVIFYYFLSFWPLNLFIDIIKKLITKTKREKIDEKLS